jgi:spore germination cell wall hydrolase CwlJ-like protein
MQAAQATVHQYLRSPRAAAYGSALYLALWLGYVSAIGVEAAKIRLPEVTPVEPVDAELLARLLWGENANTLTEEEAMGIGDSVLNRLDSPHYPKTIKDVILQPNQYTPFNRNDPNYTRIQRFDPSHPKWQQYMSLATKILDPARKRSATTHYFSQSPPRWASSMIGLAKKGAHWFGQEDPESRKKPLKIAVADAFMERDR